MASPISSRTPEGVPNRCPVCGVAIRIEPSQPPGDAPCPRCGVLLWFARTSTDVRFYEAEAVAPIREEVFKLVCEAFAAALGVSKENLNLSTRWREEVGADSLDVVELVMELEEEFGTAMITDYDAKQFQTLGDLVDFIVRQRLGLPPETSP